MNKKLINAYKVIFAGPDGQTVLDDLSRYCLDKDDIFSPDSARKTDFNLGANNVYRYIVSQIERDIDDVEEIDAINTQEN